MDNKKAIIILNFNGENHLETYLPSVISHHCNSTIIIIDNASTDDSINFIEKNYLDKVEIIKLDKNYGFAGGYNRGIEQIKQDFEYYILLNSDIELTKDWLTPIIEYLEENEDVAACQPKILSHSDKSEFEYAGACGGFLDNNYYPFCRGRIFNEIEKDLDQYNYNTHVHWTSGACMVIRSNIFKKVEGFDPDFFAHMEEIDMCLRISALGYKLTCIGKSKVFHLGGGTLNYNSPRKTYLNFRNNLTLIIKNHQGLLIPKLFMRMTLDGVAACMFLFQFKWANFWQVGKSHAYMYLNFRKNYKKRIKIKQGQLETITLYKGNILLDFFLKRNRKYSELNLRRFEL